MKNNTETTPRRPARLLHLQSNTFSIDRNLQYFVENRVADTLGPFDLGSLDIAIEREGPDSYRCRILAREGNANESVGVTGASSPRAALLAALRRTRRSLGKTHGRKKLQGLRRLAVTAAVGMAAFGNLACGHLGPYAARPPPVDPEMEMVVLVHLTGGEPSTEQIAPARPLDAGHLPSRNELSAMDDLFERRETAR